jgi:hypothetical protein
MIPKPGDTVKCVMNLEGSAKIFKLGETCKVVRIRPVNKTDHSLSGETHVVLTDIKISEIEALELFFPSQVDIL